MESKRRILSALDTTYQGTLSIYSLIHFINMSQRYLAKKYRQAGLELHWSNSALNKQTSFFIDWKTGIDY